MSHKYMNNILLLFLIIMLTAILPILSSNLNGIIIFNKLTIPINKNIIYQLITLGITILFLLLLNKIKKIEFKTYFKKGNISAPIIDVPIIGIKAKENENWLIYGRNFAIIITIVTAITMYFQTLKVIPPDISIFFKVLPFAIIFAVINSFVEEIITRFAVVIALKNVVNDKYISLISAIIFGVVHYFGNPGGLIGVLVAGFLAWLLCKSILETKGIFWAWLIHFLQDIVIFSVLFSV